MEKDIQIYKDFANKKCFVKTISDYGYTADKIILLDKGISFYDKFGRKIVLAYSEIKMIQELEVKNGKRN